MSTYVALDSSTVIDYLRQCEEVRAVFAPDEPLWAREVGDGNLNLVFQVYSQADPRRSLVVKQALPYVRCVGPSWPMTLERNRIEGEALQVEWAICPGRVPRLYRLDVPMALMVMENLEPHVIMRKGLIARKRYPRFAEHIGTFMAHTLFKTSDLYLDHATKKREVARFINPDLCKITEDLVFTHPYMEAEGNRWNRLLDPEVERLRADQALKDEIFWLKDQFMTRAQALIHGDLHTGSIMVTEDDTRVIDPEFAFYGPMGFDVGAVLGNLCLSYASHEGHTLDPDERCEYQEYLLGLVRAVWTVFEREFRRLWDEHPTPWPGGAYQDRYLLQLLRDSAGFGGCKMMRRVLGLAHVLDLDSIPDPATRARAESLALAIGQSWVRERESLASIDDLITLVRHARPAFPYD